MVDNLFTFFAVVAAGGVREIRRVRVSGPVQTSLSATFVDQVGDFIPDGVEYIDYDPGYSPDEDQVFRVPGFSLPETFAAAVAAPDAPPLLTAYDIEDKAEGEGMKALVAARLDGRELLFQNFDASQVLRRSGLTLVLSRDTFRHLGSAGLRVGRTLSAIFADGHLLFRSEHQVRRYLDLDSLFRPATDEEIDDFVGHSEILTPVPALQVKAIKDQPDQWLRRKVTSILRRGLLKNVTVSNIANVAAVFAVPLKIQGRGKKARIVLPEDKKELKMLLRFLDEDLLEGPLTHGQYLTNSKRRWIHV